MKKDIGKQLIKWVPMLAALYAFYEYYSDRGIEGIKADLDAITIQGIQAKLSALVMGFGLFIFSDMLAPSIAKNRYIRILIRTIGYYLGARFLAGALRQGAGYGGGRSTTRRTSFGGSRMAANPYMR